MFHLVSKGWLLDKASETDAQILLRHFTVVDSEHTYIARITVTQSSQWEQHEYITVTVQKETANAERLFMVQIHQTHGWKNRTHGEALNDSPKAWWEL